MAGEEKYIFPFRSNADIKLDSFHPCEPGLIATEALTLLETVEGTEFENEAREYRNTLDRFERIERSALIKESLLCEFLGKP